MDLTNTPPYLGDFPRHDRSTRPTMQSPPYREPYDNGAKIMSSAKRASEAWIEKQSPADANCFTLAVVDKMEEL